MDNVSYITAFTAGLLTFFAPCTFVALPTFITYLTSQAVDNTNNGGQIDRWKIVKSSLAYVIGFLLVFVALGITATTLSQNLRLNKDTFSSVGGFLMVFAGLFMLYGDKISRLRFLFMEKKLHYKPSHHKFLNGYFVPFTIGATTAFAWTPCIGPVLGSILFLAGASSSTPLQGGFLLLVHGLGITIPFMVLALLFEKARPFVAKMNRYTPIIYKVTAVLIIVMGIAMFTGISDNVAAWVFRIFSRLGYSI